MTSDSGGKLENFVACSLLKSLYAQNDYHATNFTLQYLRTKDKVEVDFALVNNDKVEQIIEVKSSNSDLHSGLKYFHNKYNLPSVQIVNNLRIEKMFGNIKILDLNKYLSEQFM